ASALHIPRSAAGQTRVVGQVAASLAQSARFGQGEAAKVGALVPGPRTPGADPRGRSRLGPAAPAGGARDGGREREALRGAGDRFGEAERGLGFEVGAPPRLGGAAAAAEQSTEEVGEPFTPGRGVAEQVAEVEVADTAPARPVGPAEQRPGLVVL